MNSRWLPLEQEIERGKKHGPYASLHEAYAVIAEELDELWDQVRSRKRDLAAVCHEALQIASTAFRLYEEVRAHLDAEGDQ